MPYLPASSTRSGPIDRQQSGAQMKANFVAGQTRSPGRSSWHQRPKVAGLLLSKVCRAWPPGLARQDTSDLLSHSCPARCACACHGVVIAEEVPRRRRCRRKASAPKLPLTSDRAGTDRQDPSTARRRSGSSNRVVRLQCTAPSRHPKLEPIHK